MAKTNPLEFLQEVRQEAKKITWPSRKETMITTVMVLIMVVLASVFFLVVDAILKWGVEKMLFGM
ncbi:preprotein translocase subunit SecE [Aestuariivirga sp. YIM B02566]|jgi:preprotein translocase subunit SecE|uniref:Preprotein translocase subunit SecE n=1 Tax=Taklimakanibacter albus TaxID=2800327 RepID=A0ACC5QZ13_9HYPH|nr:preprotein translocase subunit SecE [Aestuariivirga sp. YIM B02566]MBK1865607.1 preprotein translocase subunit SecE [Aestuariivirga sp. YIM B02566]